ncbi:prospero homeobox protein 1-like [Centroberyx affinis]|uniref:prospero homeobox protein 1-like n=1 Tax=Centroberyx affinis TaxID=166261 RepID=UPI003A5BADB6
MYSSNIYLDSCSAEHLPSFQPDPTLSSHSDESGISVLLHKDIGSNRILPESAYYSSNDIGSSVISSSQVEPSSSPSTDGTVGPLSTRRHLSPAANSCAPHDWTLNSGHQAKRARVENIIKGMTGSPGMHFTDVAAAAGQHEESDSVRENQRTQDLPLHQDHMQRSGAGGTSHRSQENQTTRRQIQSGHQPLRQLRTRFTHVDVVNEAEEVSRESFVEENDPTWSDSPSISPRDTFTDPSNEFESTSSRKYQGWKKVKLMNYFQSKPDKIKLMADILKYELSRAVSMSVDSIFKSMPLLQGPPNDKGSVDTDNMSLLNLNQKNNKSRLPCCERAEVQVPDVQTEALSLVVQKPPQARCGAVNLQPKTRPHHCPKPPFPFGHHIALHEDRASENIHNGGHQNALRCFQDGYPGVDQAKLERFDASWNPVKVRSKVNSRSVRSPQTHPVSVDPMLLESLCLPHVKIESDGLQTMVKNNLYVLNEGLTTNHLKKAKLMFFYTRYPSSLVLKTFFHDVQFTRCITSQLIKWFSNFREFYYIQMEKFARHAILEGAADVMDLTVGRESELFRALNMHYNKANDFQVPDRFLEVAEITLREFYIAISMGKDRDPSWKKAIYKVICKLDSDVPAEFKSHHSG